MEFLQNQIIAQDTASTVINHEMLEMFRAFKERGAISENIFEKIVNTPEYRSTTKWRQVIEEYRDAIRHNEDPLEHSEFVELVEQEAKSIEEVSKDQITEEDSAEIDNDQTLETESLAEDQALSKTEEGEETTPFTKSSSKSVSISGKQDFIKYHIQIAASRKPLTENELANIYSGKEDIMHFKEDDWEKYYISEFTRFDKAANASKNVGVRDAFVIAFCLGEKIIAYRARHVEKIFASTKFGKFHNDPNPQFRIQIASSKIPMSEWEAKRLGFEPSHVGIIYENKLFKYSIPGGNSLEEAKEIAKSTNIDGAFVVKYNKGKQTN
ncbi:MAG: hypothetical protein ACLFNU_00210 [Bacteroidales bacterium]